MPFLRRLTGTLVSAAPFDTRFVEIVDLPVAIDSVSLWICLRNFLNKTECVILRSLVSKHPSGAPLVTDELVAQAAFKRYE